MKHASTVDNRSTLSAAVSPTEWQKARDKLLAKEKHETGE
jgi:predicted dithiol-disulfide oxidoreductase (DUF899 family)